MSDVQPQKKSWAGLLITAGLALSFFWGGAINVALSEKNLKKHLDKFIQNQTKYIVNYDSVAIQLSENLIPVLQFKLKNVEIKSASKCVLKWDGVTPELNLKIGIFKSLLQKKVIISELTIPQATLKHSDQECDVDLDKPSSVVGTTEAPSEVAKISALTLPEIHIGDLWVELDLYYLRFKNVELQSGNGINKIQYHLDLKRFGSSFEQIKPLKGTIELGQDNIKVEMKGRINEGAISILGTGDEGSALKKITVNISNVPLENILQFSDATGLINTKTSKAPLWLNCSLVFGIQDRSVFVRDNRKCQLDSTGSSVVLQNFKIKGQEISDFKMKFVSVPVKLLLQSLGRTGLDRVFPDPGLLTGNLEFKGVNNIDFSWTIENLNLFFSKQGQAVVQAINSIRGRMSWDGERVSGKVDDVQLVDGEFDGFISFDADKKFNQVFLQAAAKKMRLGGTVNKIMFNGGAVGPNSFFGRGKISDGILESWQGQVGVTFINYINFDVSNLKMKLDYTKDLGVKISSTGEINNFSKNAVTQFSKVTHVKSNQKLEIKNFSIDLASDNTTSWSGEFKGRFIINNQEIGGFQSTISQFESGFQGTFSSYPVFGQLLYKQPEWEYKSVWPEVEMRNSKSPGDKIVLKFKEGIFKKTLNRVLGN